MPHNRSHVLAEVSKGGAEHVEQAIAAPARPGTTGRARRGRARGDSAARRGAAVGAVARHPQRGDDAEPVEDGAPGRDRCRLRADRLLAVQRGLHAADLRGAADLAQGTWNRLGTARSRASCSRSARSTSPRSAAISTSPALMGNTVIWKPATTAALSAYYVMRILQAAGLPDGVINLVYGPGSPSGTRPSQAGSRRDPLHGSTPVFQGMWRTVGENIDRYRSYPRLVGETGGKDFIVAHPSAEADAVATAILRGSFEYQAEMLRRVARVPPEEPLERRPRPARRGGASHSGRRRDGLRELHGGRDRRRVVSHAGGRH